MVSPGDTKCGRAVGRSSFGALISNASGRMTASFRRFGRITRSYSPAGIDFPMRHWMSVSLHRSTVHCLKPMKTRPAFSPKSDPDMVNAVPLVPSAGLTTGVAARATGTAVNQIRQMNVLKKMDMVFLLRFIFFPPL